MWARQSCWWPQNQNRGTRVRDNMAQNAQNNGFLPAVITPSWLNQSAYGRPEFKLTVPNEQTSHLPKRPILMLASEFIPTR